jgi:hypothetical protein
MKRGKVKTMNLDALLKAGCVPWSPNSSASDLDVWHQYDHPLAGTFSFHGMTMFFTIVVEFESASVWAYTCLSPEEAQGLADLEFESVPDLRAFIEKQLAGRKIAFALAYDLRIRNWSVTDQKSPLNELGIAFLNQVLDGLKNQRDSGTMLRAKLAQVDVASMELVDA